MKGKCLCGRVEFELHGEIPKLYQCHCSRCRRVSGASGSASLRIPAERFEWLAGQELITRFEIHDDYKSHFCNRCGSPLPNPTAEDRLYWVPAGLLDDEGGLELAMHVFVASRASWDIIADAGEHYEEMPPAEALGDLLPREQS